MATHPIVEININETGNVDLSPISQRLDSIDAVLTALQKQGVTLMATIQQVQDDLNTIKQETGDYIASRDAIDATLNATIADLTAQLASGQATAAQVQAGIDAAFVTAEEAKAALAPPTGVVVPLAASFPDNASFVAAVAAYTGPEAVMLDGAATSKTGTSPSLDYFTHSATGGVDMTGPTD